MNKGRKIGLKKETEQWFLHKAYMFSFFDMLFLSAYGSACSCVYDWMPNASDVCFLCCYHYYKNKNLEHQRLYGDFSC